MHFTCAAWKHLNPNASTQINSPPPRRPPRCGLIGTQSSSMGSTMNHFYNYAGATPDQQQQILLHICWTYSKKERDPKRVTVEECAVNKNYHV